MKKILHRFLWQREDEPQNMLTYLFLLVNFTYGIAFSFFGATSPVMNSIINQAFFPGWAWGVACLLIVLLTLVAIATRNRRLGTSIAYPAMGIWGYGLVLSSLEMQLLAAFAVYLPQILFWLFWHIGVIRYYNRQDDTADQLLSRTLLDKPRS